MTHTTQTKKCPHCGKVYSKRTVSGSNAEDKLIKFGNVFVTCQACGKSFVDSDIYELAVMDPPARFVRRFDPGSVALAIVFGCLGIVALFGIEKPLGAFLACVGIAVVLLVLDFLRYRRNTKTVETERERSRERLKKNPQYALALKQAGFKVPNEYLPKT